MKIFKFYIGILEVMSLMKISLINKYTFLIVITISYCTHNMKSFFLTNKIN